MSVKLVTDITDLIEIARSKTAVDGDFPRLDRVEKANTRIEELDEATRQAIAAANQALAGLPVETEINFSNLRENEAKIVTS